MLIKILDDRIINIVDCPYQQYFPPTKKGHYLPYFHRMIIMILVFKFLNKRKS